MEVVIASVYGKSKVRFSEILKIEKPVRELIYSKVRNSEKCSYRSEITISIAI